MTEPIAPAASPVLPGPATLAPGGGPAPALRRAILVHLRRTGPSAPDALAAALGAVRSGVAQQLRALDDRRPRHRRTASATASAGRATCTTSRPTPRTCSRPTTTASRRGLLAAILEVGGDDLVEEVFAARRRQAEARLRGRARGRAAGRRAARGPRPRARRLQDELGYLARGPSTDGGELRLVEHNCACWTSPRRTPAACQAELELFAELLGAEVVRERHIASGDRCCEYRVGPTA